MANSPSDPARPGVPSYDYSLFGPVEQQPLDAIRQIIGRRMTASWQNVPHVTHHEDVDITALDALRHGAASGDRPLSALAFIIKACIAGLKAFPDMNSSLSEDGKALHLKQYYNIGMAVDTPMGLIVPVLKGADQLDLPELSAATAALAEKARNGKLGYADTEGGTFTVTSLGKLGGTGFSPIINAPEVAIMGVSRARQKPVEHDGAIALRLILPLSLSYDHRVIDGAKAARFMATVRDLLQEPDTLL
ncbi:2-oxo acid dehydrogenase subunit E2 [Paenirhodobacter sp. CAU 1674]|uniref:2-oxo acid dehydrogenase subunit E2 n=1 Tax=Paenirhodobacter sp. CAU 1674 TaxID=3032596 RepID=UPI0023DCC9EB|nr:2-oxo acid dehydrogenase subunit E2 [Paenirhodobacter sp. CAU 1674]MDF2141400.1 2-oxo acid dehydrogenase subunit E2 [Paenirhodobacter sp. CAU 1674]